MDFNKESLKLHEKYNGKLEVKLKVPLKNKNDLSTSYTPGVAEVCKEISKNKKLAYKYTIKNNSIAVVSDGSAVLGLGDIGPLAAIPVMEGKSILFKEFGNIDAFPICLDTKDTEKIIETIRLISPVFGGINLEDISAPRCFEIEEKLQDLGIPVMHDDQHGTEVVVIAALKNACKVTGKNFNELKIVINGAGAAGIAISRALLCLDSSKNICDSIHELVLCDTKGIISRNRKDLNKYKEEIAKFTRQDSGVLEDAMRGADIFIGVSKANLVNEEMIKSMNQDPIIIALANPIPEIMPDLAKKAGASIVATGRSDFPNQVNNSLAFPGIFRGALDARAVRITPEMRIAASNALASSLIPKKDQILPTMFDKKVHSSIAKAVKKQAEEQGVVRY